MHQREQTIVRAIIEKANRICPGVLELVGIYGSMATGDTHAKSDLDLLVLINDVSGYQLAECFLLDDCGIGYDIYCTTWEMLARDADCPHAHLSKLLDSQIIWTGSQNALTRLEDLRSHAMGILVSSARYAKSMTAFSRAKEYFAECYLSEKFSQVLAAAGGVIYSLLDAVMLYHGKYFRLGTKRTFEELASLQLPFDTEAAILSILRSTTPQEVRNHTTALLHSFRSYMLPLGEKAPPSPENLQGTYEEMVSNWRNKMHEAAGRKDVYSSFMNMLCLQGMLEDISQSVSIPVPDVLERFNPEHTQANAYAVDDALRAYRQACTAAGVFPHHYADAEAFAKRYLQS